MKVLWTINTPPPTIAKAFQVKSMHAISWVEAMSEALQNDPDIQLAIAAPANIQKVECMKIHGIMYYLIPQNGHLKNYWEEVLTSFLPDVIHVYGTESRSNYELVTNCADKYNIVISLQGLLSEYYKHYYAGLSLWEIIRFTTIADIVFQNGIISGKRKFKKGAVHEAKMLQSVTFVEGRSDWDKNIACNLNHHLRYFHCARMIRQPFYAAEWLADRCEKHSIFIHQGNYPIKGLHFVLKAVSTLTADFPDIKIYISGNNFTKKNGIKDRLVSSGYHNYISHLIAKYKLKSNIVFTGYLDAEQLATMLEKVNLCVNSSAIENMPNSVVEAMLVGTPCIASRVGGTPEMLAYGEYGLLYDYDNTAMLANCIRDVFENEEDAKKRAGQSRIAAHKKHDPESLIKTLKQIYAEVSQH